MDLTKEFAERYKKMSNVELMEILEHPSHYQPEALNIAEKELNSRQLSQKEVQEANLLLEEKKIKLRLQTEKNEFIKSKIKNAGDLLYDTVNPVQTTKATAEKIIRFLSIIFFVFAVYELLHNSQILLLLLKGNFSYPFGYTVFLYPVLIMFCISILLWKRKQAGWILTCFFSCYSLVLAANMLYNAIVSIFIKDQFLFFRPSPYNAIVSLLFYAGALYALCRNDVREIYRIDKQKMQLSIIAGTVVGLFFIFAQHFFY